MTAIASSPEPSTPPHAANDGQVKRLKKALGRGIDQLRWNAIFSTKSVPIPPPKSSHIAIKMIAETGIEMTVTRTVKT